MIAAKVDGYFELADESVVEKIYTTAREIDDRVGNADYVYRHPADAIAAILNGSDLDQLAEFFQLILREGKGGWSFSPEGGW